MQPFAHNNAVSKQTDGTRVWVIPKSLARTLEVDGRPALVDAAAPEADGPGHGASSWGGGLTPPQPPPGAQAENHAATGLSL
jgi:hypothetical protein